MYAVVNLNMNSIKEILNRKGLFHVKKFFPVFTFDDIYIVGQHRKGRRWGESGWKKLHPASNCFSAWGWGTAGHPMSSRNMLKWFWWLWDVINLANPRIGKCFQGSLADMVHLRVTICPDICCQYLTGVVVQFILPSFLCYATRCPLQALINCHILRVHLGMLSNTPP